MPEITDEYMQAQLATSREYVLVLLKEGENYRMEDFRSFPGDALAAAASPEGNA